MELTEFVGFAGLAVVIALVEGVKRMFPELAPRFYPAVALTAGVLWNLAVTWVLRGDLQSAALVGVAVGLAAAGLFSWGKAREVQGL